MIDSHLHFWNPEHLTYDWLQYVPAISGRMGPEEFAGVADLEGAIFVQADCEEALEEVDWVNSLSFPILGIVAYAPLELGDTPHIQALKAKQKVVGIRRNAQNEPDGFMTSEGYIAGMIATARAGFSLDMCIRARQLPELRQALARLLEAVPEARIVLDHLGKPDIRTHGADISGDDWANEIKTLSEMPNVFCKLSGLPTEADWDHCPPEQLRPWLDHALNLFGPSRCLFGGDWPVVNLAGGYSRWQAVVASAVSHLPEDQQTEVWSGTARTVYQV
ncbi:amidohydrolase family protein [Asticcacaulis taihuensis]|uniref:L-fuconolactonase n=1 Tax=Asticcacaulis taihuensis TaxID=260084 RepID=A0A1G4RYN5_9CAUL|nr:amidohydrolase family protein [Asticcacaulis taihuensis]SCW62162.1 L-fuconolactonase [Asticcacaulis taihuensis]